MTKPHIDFASLDGVHRRQGPCLPGNCFATVLCKGVGAGADMQGLELEEKFTLRAVKGKGEEEVWDETLALPGWHRGGGTSASRLRDARGEQAEDFRTAPDAHFRGV